MLKEVIGIIGTIGAGKDTAGDYIADKLNIPIFQISSPLKSICLETGIEPSRENLIELGTKLAVEHGDGYLAEYIIEHMDEERAVITGMRQLGQIDTLKSLSKLTLISIEATPTIRFERARNNGKVGEASNLEEFITRERAENSAPNAQRLFECMKLADYHITNESSLEDLYSKLDNIFRPE
jgi:dephospho-CoA kinase